MAHYIISFREKKKLSLASNASSGGINDFCLAVYYVKDIMFALANFLTLTQNLGGILFIILLYHMEFEAVNKKFKK